MEIIKKKGYEDRRPRNRRGGKVSVLGRASPSDTQVSVTGEAIESFKFRRTT